MLILLGDGVVANVTLNKSGMKGAGSIQITFAWGLAVMIPAFIFGAASGASFNPALTLALAIDGSFAWGLVPGYIIAQFAGAFTGAILVYLLFKDQFDATEDAATKRGVFCTAPAVRNIPRNILSEAVGTFVLVFAIKGLAQVPDLADGTGKFLRQEIWVPVLHMQCFRFREKVPLISDTDSLFRSSDRSSAHWLPYWYTDLFFKTVD